MRVLASQMIGGCGKGRVGLGFCMQLCFRQVGIDEPENGKKKVMILPRVVLSYVRLVHAGKIKLRGPSLPVSFAEPC
jgi:hypothetical protein